MAVSNIPMEVSSSYIDISLIGVNRRFYIYGDTVYVYMYLSGLPSTDEHSEIGVLPTELTPATNYMILTAYKSSLPYEPIGSMWASVNNHLHIYKPKTETSLYVFGSYLRKHGRTY